MIIYIQGDGDIEDWYNGLVPEKVVFEWINGSEADYKRYQNKQMILKSAIQSIPLNIKEYKKVPFDIHYTTWGSQITEISNKVLKISKIKFNSDIDNIIVRFDNDYRTRVTLNYSAGSTISFIDFKQSDSTYCRIINNNLKYYFDDNSNPYFVFNNIKSYDKIPVVKPADKYEFNVGTLDIETFIDKNNHKIICVCLYDGAITHKLYIKDYNSQEDLVLALFERLLQSQYHKYSFYIHNGSSFDLVFLLNQLCSLTNKDIRIKPTYKDGKFLNIRISFIEGKNRYYINIKDSILLLNSSLAKLAKQFNLEDKGMFPYSFPKLSSLDYIGEVPSYSYFNSKNISLERYESYKNSFNNKLWNLRDEVLAYCELDCILLYNILKSFSALIYDNYNVNIENTFSLPSLAFKIYRSKFMPTENMIDPSTGEEICDKEGNVLEEGMINNIGRDWYNSLKSAYFGGHVDMYIPAGPIANDIGTSQPKDGKLVAHDNNCVYHYDINSLYPSAMAQFKFPNKLYAKFIGDIRYSPEYSYIFESENFLGIFKVRVSTPLDLKHPILPYRCDNGRVIYPTGTWEGMYCSEELKNAEKYGYKFDIINGYLFTAVDLFSGYIETFNKIKESSEKSSPMYLISKMLMNSLYGRFGLNPALPKHIISTKKDIEVKLEKELHNLEDRIDFGKYSLCSFDNNKSNVNSNVAIAAYVTAYARVLMSRFMNRSDLTLFYTDTDSVFFDKPLDDSEVDNKKLGFMKLEAMYQYFASIGSKCWIGVTEDGSSTCKLKGSKYKISYLDF